MGRSLGLYSLDLFLLTVLSITVFFTMRQISLYLEPGSTLRNVLDGLSLLPAIVATLWFSAALFDTAMFPEALAFPFALFLSATMVYDISRRSQGSAGFFRNLAVGGLVLGMVANLAFYTGLPAALACVVVGLVLLVYGFRVRQRGMFTGGAVLLVAGMLQQLYELVQQFNLSDWAGLVTFGVVAIVVASVMESQGGKFKPRLESWKTGFRQWEK